MKSLDMVGISHLKDKAPSAIATVLSMQPDILVMDEPTSSLDPRSRRRKNFEHTKIITSHDLDMVLEICERTIVLKQGKVAADKELMNTCGLEVPLALQGCPVCGEKKKYV